MTILNEAELKAKNDNLFQTGVQGGVTAAKLREYNVDQVESLQSYGSILIGAEVDNISVTNSGSNWTEYTHQAGSSALLQPTFFTGTISAFEPALYFVTIRFNGKWNAGEDLSLRVHVNGVENVMTPIELQQEGQGSNDPVLISATDMAFIVNSGMIAAGGGQADITLFVSSTTGTFLVDQTTVTFGARYNPLSIRTVG